MEHSGPRCRASPSQDAVRYLLPLLNRGAYMSKLCFSFPADVPPGIGVHGAVRPDLRAMPTTICFRYEPEVPRSRPAMCFSYPADPLPSISYLRRMPAATCFRY